ncbi:MAG: hypothetical protein R2860_11855 [Desulfobacterales bacterium]
MLSVFERKNFMPAAEDWSQSGCDGPEMDRPAVFMNTAIHLSLSVSQPIRTVLEKINALDGLNI